MCGQRGSGKTTYIRTRVLAVEPRLLVYDHMAEFYDRVGGAHVVYDLPGALAYMKQHRTGISRLFVVPTKPTIEEFRLLCRIPFAYPGTVLVCDEIDQFAQSTWPPEEFRRLVHFGRHVDCGFVGASRRPADVSRAFTSQARRFVCFRQTEPKDLTFWRSIVGGEADKLKDLPPLTYLAFEGGRTMRGTVNPGGARPEPVSVEDDGDADEAEGLDTE